MMFAEHSFEVKETQDGGCKKQDGVVVTVRNVTVFKLRCSQLSGLGYFIGFVILLLQFICGLQNFGFVGSWTNAFAVLADILVVALGFALIYQEDSDERNKSSKLRRSEAKGVDLMVAIMGVAGFVYWILMIILHTTWLKQIPTLSTSMYNYLEWSAVKSVFRATGIILQLYIFIKCDPFFGCRKGVRGKSGIFFILPTLMLSFLSIFVMAIMDGHVNAIESLVESSNLCSSVVAFMKVSEPLYLGFCLHLFLHFFISHNNLKALEYEQCESSVEMRPLASV